VREWFVVCCAVLLSMSPAQAQEDEKYLLGDLGVRLELSDAWRMTRWSDWDFKAQIDKGPILLWVWSTDGQVPPGADAEPWLEAYTERIESEGGHTWSDVSGEVGSVGGTAALLMEMRFQAGRDKTDLYLYGATFAVEGQNVHVATLATKKHRARAEAMRETLLSELELRKPAVSFARQREAETMGVSLTLPDGFRPAFEGSEEKAMMGQVSSLPVNDFSDCIVAMRPLPMSTPDVFVMCQGGIWLGVVDTHTLSSVGPLLAEKFFGTSLQVDPPVPLALSDRMGLIYKPELDTFSLGVGVVPYDQGVARYWVMSDTPGQDMSSVVREVVEASSFSGPHPEPVGAQLQYWLMHRTTSPPTLLALFLLLGVPGGLFWKSRGGSGKRKNRFEIDDDLD
jgi:hypothetical protein